MNYDDLGIKEKDLKKNKIRFQVLQTVVDGKVKYLCVQMEHCVQVFWKKFWYKGKDLTDILQCQQLRIKTKEKELEYEKERMKVLEQTLDILVTQYSAKKMVFGDLVGEGGASKSHLSFSASKSKDKGKTETISLVQGKFQEPQRQGNQKNKGNQNNQQNN